MNVGGRLDRDNLPFLGSLVMVRVVLAMEESAATRFTGPIRLIRFAM